MGAVHVEISLNLSSGIIPGHALDCSGQTNKKLESVLRMNRSAINGFLQNIRNNLF